MKIIKKQRPIKKRNSPEHNIRDQQRNACTYILKLYILVCINKETTARNYKR